MSSARPTSRERPEAPRIARWIFLFSLSPALLLTLEIGTRDHRYLPVAAAIAVAGAFTAWAIPRLVRGNHAANALLLLASLNLVLPTPELYLRAISFRYESGIEFGYPKPSYFIAFDPHPDLFWTLRTDAAGVNSWGFPGPEIEIPKPPDVTRIVVLGDSCSQSGYPDELDELLNTNRGAGEPRFEVNILAISGYSSLQGRRIADLHAQQLGADAALVYFGWNDHWKAWGEPDAEKQIAMPGSRIGRLHALLLQRVRLVGFAQWLRDSLAGRQKRRSGGVRVPPDHYRENLAAIAETFRASGSEVFFLTAPSAHARLGTPGYLVDGGLVTREGEAVELHRRYNDITRGVAADRNVALVDLAAGMESLPDAELERLFRTDGIHFLPEGERWIAERVARALRASPVPSARVSADGEPSDLPHPRL